MSKRKSPEARELSLFDLPLRPDDEEAPTGGPSLLEDAPDLPLEDASDLPLSPSPGPRRLALGKGAATHEPAVSEPVEEELSAASGGDPAPDRHGMDGREEDGDREDGDQAPEPALLRDRLLSGLVDLGIQLLVIGGAAAAVRAMGISVQLEAWPPFAILGTIFSFLYWFIPLAFWGQTPGMAWVGNSALNQNGEPLTFGQSVLRWLGAVLTLALLGLPLLLALGGGSLSDRLSGSKTEILD